MSISKFAMLALHASLLSSGQGQRITACDDQVADVDRASCGEALDTLRLLFQVTYSVVDFAKKNV